MAALAETVRHLLETVAARRKLRAVARLERRLERALGRAFRLQGREFLEALGRAGAAGPSEAVREAVAEPFPPDWEELLTAAELATLAAFEGPIDEAVRAAMAAGIQVALADLALDVVFDLANPRAVAFLEGHAAESVRGIHAETRQQLRRLIADGVRDGWSYDRIARAIRERFEGFARPQPQRHIRSRAHLVAVTETAYGYEAGNRAVADELQAAGIAIEKSWLTVGDGRVDPDCQANAAAGWIPVSQAFPAGAMQAPQHPACRCTVLYRRADSGD